MGNNSDSKGNEINSFIVMNAGVPGKKIGKIPSKIYRAVGSLIDQYVWLITVDGRNWIVDVERRNNNIWLSSTLDRFKGEYQILPDEFSMKFRMHLENSVTLVGVDGLKWIVRWCVIDGSIWLREGWADFVLYNNLKKNDFLIFKLGVDGDMKVRLVREDAGMVETAAIVRCHDTLDVDVKVRELWTAQISTASIKRGLALYVPADVVRDFLRKDMAYVSVLLPSGAIEQWELIWSPGRKGECHLEIGWYDFRDRNHLAPGDLMKFSRRGAEDQMIVELL